MQNWCDQDNLQGQRMLCCARTLLRIFAQAYCVFLIPSLHHLSLFESMMNRSLSLISSSVLLAVAANAQCFTATGTSVAASLVATAGFPVDDEGRTPDAAFTGFTFPMGGTNWTHFAIESNGEIYLTDGSGVVNPALYGISGLVEMRGGVGGSPRIAPLGGDNQGVVGLASWDILVDDTIGGQLKVTWTGMRNYAGTEDFSMSATLFASGDVQFDYPVGQNFGTLGAGDFVGLSIGNDVGTATTASADLNVGAGDSGVDGIVYQNTWTPFDLENQSVLFLPNGTGGYLYIVVCGTSPNPPATNTEYGVGCGGSAIGDASVYELHTAFDLSSTGHTYFWGAGTYVLTDGAGPIATPTGAPVAFGDDDTQAVALPFAMPSASGVINEVYLCSNGWLSFVPTTNADYTESVAELLSDENRLAFLWDDMNPSAGGTIHTEAVGVNEFHITFTNVPEYGQTNSNDCQVVLYDNGSIEVRYGVVASLDVLVGYSTGGGATDPGATDFSNLAAAPVVVMTGVFVPNLSLVGATRPIIGTNWDLTTSGIPAVSPISLTFFGARNPTPLPLSLIGINAPGCDINLASIAFDASAVSLGGTSTTTLPLPNTPSFIGSLIAAQSLSLTLSNPANIIVSNGLEGFVSDN
ncbi:MAG: hypothetical protein ACI9SE_003938 [Neolewinella sp.]